MAAEKDPYMGQKDSYQYQPVPDPCDGGWDENVKDQEIMDTQDKSQMSSIDD